jgi:hypothetical protein
VGIVYSKYKYTRALTFEELVGILYSKYTRALTFEILGFVQECGSAYRNSSTSKFKVISY